LIEQGRTWACALAAAVCVGAIAAPVAAADNYRVTRASISPASGGSPSAPRAVGVGFGLGIAAADRSQRPQPIKSYAIGVEGVLAYPSAFPSCSLAQAKARRGPAKPCAKALVGDGLIRAAAGLDDDLRISESLPCNLRLRLYNTGAGAALRIDADTPYPPGFGSRKIGCPVPMHTAIKGRFVRTTIDGLAAMDLTFTLPKLLLQPLQDWAGALQLVDASLGRATASMRINGRQRTVGYFSSIGCRGGSRLARAAFTDLSGNRFEATKALAC
jgi:hypothetical protein